MRGLPAARLTRASADSNAPDADVPIPYPAERESEPPPLAPSAPLGSKVEEILALAEECLEPYLEIPAGTSADYEPVWRCLQRLDWVQVEAEDLAVWVCSKQRPFWLNGLVGASAWHARSGNRALEYLARFKPQCLNIAESPYQIMLIELIDRVDPRWVGLLSRSFSAEALFTPGASDQCILLAEFFLRRGDPFVTALLEEGGRGLLGGDEDQMCRAAAVCLYAHSTMRAEAGSTGGFDEGASGRAYHYAESLVTSPSTPPLTASTLGQFLTSRQTWPGGDSKPALRLLLEAIEDPRFELRIPNKVFAHSMSGPPGCDPELWSQLWQKSLQVAKKYGVSVPDEK
jgi:hypothetical protein